MDSGRYSFAGRNPAKTKTNNQKLKKLCIEKQTETESLPLNRHGIN